MYFTTWLPRCGRCKVSWIPPVWLAGWDIGLR